jgi:[acyl-carrier-protein] S-malonyltransferase
MAMKKAADGGAKKTVMLDVSGPFHSKLMQNAVSSLSEALESVVFKKPAKPLIANVTARAEVDNFKELLQKQIVSPVRWRESVLFASENGVSKCVEIGAGSVLTGLVKRTVKNMELVNINSLETLDFSKNFTKNPPH